MDTPNHKYELSPSSSPSAWATPPPLDFITREALPAATGGNAVDSPFLGFFEPDSSNGYEKRCGNPDTVPLVREETVHASGNLAMQGVREDTQPQPSPDTVPNSRAEVSAPDLATAPAETTEAPLQPFDDEMEAPHEAEGPEHPHDAILCDAQNVVLIGGTPEENARVVREVVLTHAERLAEEPKESVILVARFDSETPSYVVEGGDPELYTGINASITGDASILNHLNPGDGEKGMTQEAQVAHIYAEVAANKDPEMRDIYLEILTKALGAFQNYFRRENSGSEPPPVTPQNVRDILSFLRGAPQLEQFGAMPTIAGIGNMKLRAAIKDAFWGGGEVDGVPSELQFHSTHLHRLGVFANGVADNKPSATQSNTIGTEQPPATPGAVTVLDVGIGESLLVTQHLRQAAIGAQAVTAMIHEGTKYGDVEVLVMVDSHLAPEAAARIVRLCENKPIRIILAGAFVEESERLADIPGTVYGVMRGSTTELNMIVTRILRPIIREDVSSETGNIGSGTGESGNRSENLGYEKGSPDPNSGGTTFSKDNSTNTSLGFAQASNIGEGPPLLVPDLSRGVGPGELLIVDQYGNTAGVYDIATRDFKRRFMPQPRPKPLEVRDMVEQDILDERRRSGSERIQVQATVGKPLNRPDAVGSLSAGSKAPTELLKQDVGTAKQENHKLRALYLTHTEKSRYGIMGQFRKGSFRDFCLKVYDADLANGLTNLTWEEWREERGVDL